MDFNLSEEQQMLRDGARRFVREHYAFEARRALVKSDIGFSREYWKAYAELGWLALGLTEDVGGLGCPFADIAILLEEFGRGLVCEPYISTAVLCARIVDRCSDPEMRTEVLSEVAVGGLTLALAHDEPGHRFEVGRAEVSARPVGDGFVLDGAKILARISHDSTAFVGERWTCV